MSSPIGAHVLVGGGLIKKGLREAREIGAEAIQFFAGNPRGWKQPTADPHDAAAFRTACADLPVFVHAPYLLNFGSPDPVVLENSAQALTTIMRRAGLVGAAAVIVHAGSSVRRELREQALDRLPELFAPLLDAAPPGVRLLIEPTCGGGAALASTVDSTLQYFAALDDERIGLCIDTCHLHSAGEDITTATALHAVVTKLTDAIGPHRLDLVHANDSRDPAGSHRDRHETLGKGTLGEDVFRTLFTIPQLHDVPILVETATNGVDVALLKRLRDEVRQTDSAIPDDGSPGVRPVQPSARTQPVE
ncbi:deoxyribonuclease IV [Nocardia suismassiliense]|uniref:deoxyribonuclease IV n=1 Tax=Nocardia suismassiliense TaxID=2077092 RepID=UPI00131EFE9D|nr:deoxyribonuclease IV [Nocardia suismassiliense]